MMVVVVGSSSSTSAAVDTLYNPYQRFQTLPPRTRYIIQQVHYPSAADCNIGSTTNGECKEDTSAAQHRSWDIVFWGCSSPDNTSLSASIWMPPRESFFNPNIFNCGDSNPDVSNCGSQHLIPLTRPFAAPYANR